MSAYMSSTRLSAYKSDMTMRILCKSIDLFFSPNFSDTGEVSNPKMSEFFKFNF